MDVKSQKYLDNLIICVVGLGYVGLPLAIAFARKYKVIGFDTDQLRIAQLSEGIDVTNEVQLKENFELLEFTSDPIRLNEANVFIVTVPTPVDAHKVPDMSALKVASKTVAKNLSKGDLVIYESTVYPGATEEICIPILEDVSDLAVNTDFLVGYSPERINPGDKTYVLEKIIKVTAGSNEAAGEMVDELYKTIINAGTHLVENIKTAEAAKVIENIQRDVNIALVNEFAIIFDKLGINTQSVLKASGTKWNFLDFQPGLVGGHCIGVDPYYLTYKCRSIEYHPDLILAGRRVNDGMGQYVAMKLIDSMIAKNQQLHESKVLILGLTFKENCPDVRNTGVAKVIAQLNNYFPVIDCFDPYVKANDAQHIGKVRYVEKPKFGTYDALLLTVAHDYFIKMGSSGLRKLLKPSGLLFDVKSVFPRDESDVVI